MTHERCTKLLNHLSRIQGQIDGLKRAIEEEKDCDKVANLTSSILRSFHSARTSIIEGYILEEVLGGKSISADKAKRLSSIVSLYKS